MSEQIEHEIYSLAKTIMDVAEKIDRKAREAKSADIQESLKELLKNFQQELSKGITEREKVLETLQGQKADIDKLDNIATQAMELNAEQTKKLDRKEVLKEAKAEMVKAGFSQDAIDKTQSTINKTFDELSKALNINDVLKETRKDMQAKGFDKEVIEKTEQTIKNTFGEEQSKVNDVLKETMKDMQNKGIDKDVIKKTEQVMKNVFSITDELEREKYFENARIDILQESEDVMRSKGYSDADIRATKISINETYKNLHKSIVDSDSQSFKPPLTDEEVKDHANNRIADIFGFDDPNNPLFQNKNEVVKPVQEHVKNTEIASSVEMDSFLVQEQFVEQVQEHKEDHKNVTHENTLQPETSKENELQQEKGLTKVEFMENFKEQLKSSQDFDKDMKAQLESILDNVTTKVISPDYGKPAEWAVAKTAKKNESLEQFKDYMNNRKELNGKSKLDQTIKEAKEKTIEKQKETLEKRQNKEQTRSKSQQQIKSR